MPKSSRRTSPSLPTRMFAGFRSRCTIEPCVRVRHRIGHLQEQAQALAQVAALAAAVFVDGDALDVLEREIGLSVGREAGVVEPRDVRMLEAREDVALARHALGEVGAEHAAVG